MRRGEGHPSKGNSRNETREGSSHINRKKGRRDGQGERGMRWKWAQPDVDFKVVGISQWRYPAGRWKGWCAMGERSGKQKFTAARLLCKVRVRRPRERGEDNLENGGGGRESKASVVQEGEAGSSLGTVTGSGRTQEDEDGGKGRATRAVCSHL